MFLSLSTRWHASQHASGESMIEEILELGVDHVELGYDLTLDLVPGVRAMLEKKAVTVDSVHAFCPVPVGAPQGHPELFTLTSRDSRVRSRAVTHLTRTINFAGEMGARTVVLHAGNVEMKNLTMRLMEYCAAGEQFSKPYEKTKSKLIVRRDKKIKKQLPYLYTGIEQLMPALESARVRLAIENLPTWEAIPSETEMLEVLKHFDSPHLGYWHDLGHGEVRQNLGFINHARWLERLEPYLAGMHVHDVAKPAFDHLMPPRGTLDFEEFKRFTAADIPAVLEPSPLVSTEELKEGIKVVRYAWGL